MGPRFLSHLGWVVGYVPVVSISVLLSSLWVRSWYTYDCKAGLEFVFTSNDFRLHIPLWGEQCISFIFEWVFMRCEKAFWLHASVRLTRVFFGEVGFLAILNRQQQSGLWMACGLHGVSFRKTSIPSHHVSVYAIFYDLSNSSVSYFSFAIRLKLLVMLSQILFLRAASCPYFHSYSCRSQVL